MDDARRYRPVNPKRHIVPLGNVPAGPGPLTYRDVLDLMDDAYRRGRWHGLWVGLSIGWVTVGLGCLALGWALWGR